MVSKIVGGRVPNDMYARFKSKLIGRNDTIQSVIFRAIEEYIREVKNGN